jgi:hypothetical protein
MSDIMHERERIKNESMNGEDCQILVGNAADLGKKPWHVVDDVSRLVVDYHGNEIALVGNNALALKIVKAVNSHQQLLDASKRVIELWDHGNLAGGIQRLALALGHAEAK